jgi:hypothetical protein
MCERRVGRCIGDDRVTSFSRRLSNRLNTIQRHAKSAFHPIPEVSGLGLSLTPLRTLTQADIRTGQLKLL